MTPLCSRLLELGLKDWGWSFDVEMDDDDVLDFWGVEFVW